MSEIFPSLGYQLGIGGIGGFIVGYALKKLSKLIVIVLGLFIAALLYLGIQGIIGINYDSLWNALANSLGMAEWIVGLVSLLPFAGSFIVGFLLGFKLG